MAKFLANENVPADAVEAARNAGHDLAWVHETHAGAEDDTVLALSLSEGRVLVTFDKDFGEMAFHQGKKATSGVVLLRPRLRSRTSSVGSSWRCWARRLRGKATFAWPRRARSGWCPCPEWATECRGRSWLTC